MSKNREHLDNNVLEFDCQVSLSSPDRMEHLYGFVHSMCVDIYTNIHETKVGEAEVLYFDLRNIAQPAPRGRAVPYKLFWCYSEALSHLYDVLFDANGCLRTRVMRRIGRHYGFMPFDKQVIPDRIAVVQRRVTYPAYRGLGVTRPFYQTIQSLLRCDLLITRPFPLQYEGLNPGDTPADDEFGLPFKDALRKIRSLYLNAGMHPLDREWLYMLNTNIIKR